MAPVPLAARVVEVIADLGDSARERYRYGSGFIVRGGTVLTAAHVVAGAASIRVRDPDKRTFPASADPQFTGDPDGPGPDLALVEIDDPEANMPPVGLARVDRDSPTGDPVPGCQVIGYPAFMEQDTPGGGQIRETADASGHVPVLQRLAGGLVSVLVTHAPWPLPPKETALGQSEWSGMSGAPLLASGRLLGVVSEHAPREGLSAITVTPLTALEADPDHPGWGPGVTNPGAWWAQLGVPGTEALRRLPPRPGEAGLPTGDEVPGWPLDAVTDPFALEVHRPVQLEDQQPSLPVLPAYVPREHDTELHRVVRAAAEGRSGIAVLVGGPSSGKTRACWEALQLLRDQPELWRLWHPIDPSRPDAALRELPAIGPRTVVWLNEAQFYLDHSLGEQVAAGLRELLRDPARGPVLILATLWPEHWAALATQPTGGLDTHAQARELIVGNELRVPGTFTDDDAHALVQASALDRRLAAAASEAVDGQITQYLAGVPILLDRYTHAPPAARALIHAAMDARRLGHGPHLSHAFLAEAAPGYLTDPEWDAVGDDWLEGALAYTAQPGNGIPGPLTRIRPRTPTSSPPAYRLVDYLEHVGRTDRDLLPTPTALWDAFLEHAPESDRSDLAFAAWERGYYRYSLRLYASIPSAASFLSAAQMLRMAEHVDEALEYYTRAADAGADETAVGSVASMLRQARGAEAALSWLKARGDAGDATAMRRAAELLQAEGRTEEARVWWAHAANANDVRALVLVAKSMQTSGREKQAREIFRRAAHFAAASVSHQSADAFRTEQAVSLAAQCLVDAGDTADALALLLPRAQRRDSSALSMAAELIRDTEGVDEALAWLDSVDDAVKSEALNIAGMFLSQAGRIDEALVYFQRAGQRGDTKACVYALEHAASILRERGQIDEAMEAYQHAADICDRLGDKWRPPFEEAAAMLRANGRLDQALDWLTARADAADSTAMVIVAETLRDEGRDEEALAWLTRYADAGSVTAISEGAWQLWKAGRTEETIAWIEARSADVDAYALWEMAEMLGEAGHLDRALEYCARACNRGHGGGMFLSTLVKLLAAAGRTTEATRLRRFGREPDGRISDPWTSTGAPHEEDDAELSLPATPPEPFRVTPRPADILEAWMKKAQVSTPSELLEVMAQERQAPKSDPVVVRQEQTYRKVGRNAQCPCGSGRKYKRCHGDPRLRDAPA